jgi:trimeric autotransporter adhesin
MKIKSPLTSITLALLALSTLNSPLSTVCAQGTAFTYQGRLNNGGVPANGLYDFRFKLASDPLANNYVGDPAYTNAIPVTNGLFAAPVDFGAGIFTGSNFWLEVDVRTNNPANTLAYTMLTPLQALTPTPYAIFANSASNVSGTVSAAQLGGSIANGNLPANPVFSGTVSANSFSGNGANLTALNADNLTSGMVPLAQLSGITSNQLNAATWQLATNLNGGNAALASNVVSGIAITNAFITNSIFAGNGGGLTNLNAAQLTSIGNTNVGASDNFFVGPSGNMTTSGSDNTANGYNALDFNTSGDNNTANGYWALVSNTTGDANTASGYAALFANTNGGGNTADGVVALFANATGFFNTAEGYGALESNTSGSNNIALGFLAGANISTGSSNIDIGNQGLFTDTNLIRIGSGQTTTYIAGVINGNGGGLTDLTAANLTGTIPTAQLSGIYSGAVTLNNPGNSFAGNGAGVTNVNATALNGLNATAFWQLGGNNVAAGQFLGSTNNQPVEIWANGQRAFRLEPVGASAALGNGILTGAPNVIGGSPVNFVSSGVVGAVIGGGGATNYGGSSYTNSVSSDFGTVGGGGANTADGLGATVGGGYDNTANGYNFGYATVSGGYGNNATNDYATAGGGFDNTASGEVAVVGGGYDNTAGGTAATVGGGYDNTASGAAAFIGGGGFASGVPSGNTASGPASVIGGGLGNIASGAASVIGGGLGNTNTGNYATIPGGYLNTASGFYSFAAGTRAQATNQGAFVWADSQNAPFSSTNNDSFNVRARGGVVFVTSGAGMTLDGQPVFTGSNGGGLTNLNVSAAQLTGGANNNIFVGQPGNSTASGFANLAFGDGALQANTSGSDNSAFGVVALQANTSGSYNTAFGDGALVKNTSGSENTANGVDALAYNRSGNNNTAVGYAALYNLGINNTAGGTNNIALGYLAGFAFDANESNNIDIGNAGNVGENNIIRIGTPGIQTNTVIAGVINGNGSGLTSLNAAQLSGPVPSSSLTSVPADSLTGAGTLPAAVLPANVALLGVNQSFTGSNNFTSPLTVTNSGAVDSLMVYGTRTNGWPQPVALFENVSTVTNSSPALRLLVDGAAVDGALSCSVQVAANTPNSIIAQFGNSGAFVVTITNNGSIYTASNVYSAGNVYANGVELTSDRNAKENFTAMDGKTVLAKVAVLPVTEWNYKNDGVDKKHLGPMAQDFYAAFQLNGGDDKHISVVDEGGVALAAIQGLNQKLQEQLNRQDAENARLKQQNDSLAERLNELETTVKSLVEKK